MDSVQEESKLIISVEVPSEGWHPVKFQATTDTVVITVGRTTTKISMAEFQAVVEALGGRAVYRTASAQELSDMLEQAEELYSALQTMGG